MLITGKKNYVAYFDEAYGVVSANFSRRRIGHAQDNSSDSEMLQVRANRVCTRISFCVSKTVREIMAFFLPMTKIQLKQVNHKLGQRSVDAPSTGRFLEASSGPEKSFVHHGLVEKKKGKLRG